VKSRFLAEKKTVNHRQRVVGRLLWRFGRGFGGGRESLNSQEAEKCRLSCTKLRQKSFLVERRSMGVARRGNTVPAGGETIASEFRERACSYECGRNSVEPGSRLADVKKGSEKKRL